VSGFGGLVVTMVPCGTFGGLVVTMLPCGTFGGLVVTMLPCGTVGGLVVTMLPCGTQDRGFAPDRSRRIFLVKKILSMASFGREVNSFVQCRRCGMSKNPIIYRGSRKL
jgi:hypothetical protein